IRIASISTPSELAASSRRSGSSPGSTSTAVFASAPARTMYAFSWIGPTVNIRTSTPSIAALRSAGPAVLFAPHPPPVKPLVGVEADRHVQQEHEREVQKRLSLVVRQQHQHHNQDQHRCNQRPGERSPPGRRAIVTRLAPLPRLRPLFALDALLRRRRL